MLTAHFPSFIPATNACRPLSTNPCSLHAIFMMIRIGGDASILKKELDLENLADQESLKRPEQETVDQQTEVDLESELATYRISPR